VPTVDTNVPPRLTTTIVMAMAAVAAALIAIFGEPSSATWLSAGLALAGLVPWALEAGGVRLSTALFLVLTFVPGTAIVVADRNPGGMFPLMLATVWITRRAGQHVLTWTALALAGGSIAALAMVKGTAHETGLVYFIGGVGVAWLAGSMLRRQEMLLAEVQLAHAAEADHAAAAERAAIAREVHDVVAHSLTVTMLHVAGARRMLAIDPVRAGEALERAESVGRESLDSIRRVVGLLRDADSDSSAPLPVLSDIPDLVRQFREAGLVVTADLRLDDLSADPTTALTAFRVVQEALSNVLQHAPGAPVDLRVMGEPSGTVLRIIAENPTTAIARRSERIGLGLRGMAERVRASGGSVEAGATDDHTWRIEAALPLRRLASLA
jgi:signal transduction histidine kinase